MPKYRRVRRRFRKRTKWCSNLIDIGPNSFSLSNENWNFTEVQLITNPQYNYNLTSNLFTIKNVEVAINFDTDNIGSGKWIENLQFYIMYVPEGMTVTQDYAIKHPEYVMAMKYYGEPGVDAGSAGLAITPSYRIKTRLSRKLNTGDKIILFIRGANVGTQTFNVTYGGLCRFWTKAN